MRETSVWLAVATASAWYVARAVLATHERTARLTSLLSEAQRSAQAACRDADAAVRAVQMLPQDAAWATGAAVLHAVETVLHALARLLLAGYVGR